MKKAPILSPKQSAHYAMGRVLLTFAQWNRRYDKPVELDRLMVIDFAVQYPRTFSLIVPSVEYILRTHDFSESDLGDYFVSRKFTFIRENFMHVISDLVSRDLVKIRNSAEPTEFLLIEIQDTGIQLANQFGSRFSQIIILLADAYSYAWGEKDMKKLLGEIRANLPDSSEMVRQLAKPFGSWLEDE